MTAVDVEVDLFILDEIDFPTPCQHSQHYTNAALHDGAAEWICEAVHLCPGDESSTVYACCTRWKDHVLEVRRKVSVKCPACGAVMNGTDWCRILGPLNEGG